MSKRQRIWVWLPIMMFLVMLLYLIGAGSAAHTAQAGILAEPPAMTLTPATDTKTVGESETMTAKMTNVISPTGTVITFTVTGANPQIRTATADETGVATFTYTGNNAGTDTIVATATVLTVSLTSNTATIIWKAPTALAYNGATEGDYHDPAIVSAILTRSDTSALISGAVISFTLGGADTCAGTTDSLGQASCTITPSLIPAIYPLIANFAGDATYLASTVTVSFTVNKQGTTLTYTGPTLIANREPATLSGVLKEEGTLVPIDGQTVTFTLGSGDGAQSCTGKTNAAGVASCTIDPVNQPLGEEGTVRASFAGNDFYLPSSDSKATLIFAFLDKGSFVVGNKSATGKVTFWSSQWAKANTLSGGKAPSSFKGFANTVSSDPPSCGGTWSARPGNSPPRIKGPLPSYMGVVVASSVGKSGPKIAGNIPSIVVVKIDPGYAPNPGHRGTGTVKAVYCQPPE